MTCVHCGKPIKDLGKDYGYVVTDGRLGWKVGAERCSVNGKHEPKGT